MYYRNKIANLISKLNKLIPYPMDRQGPPNLPRYQLTRGLNRFRQQKRCYDITLTSQEGSTMRHLASAQWDWPACVFIMDTYNDIRQLFLSFGWPLCADRISNCPLDRVLTYKYLIYFLSLQFNLCIRTFNTHRSNPFSSFYLPPGSSPGGRL